MHVSVLIALVLLCNTYALRVSNSPPMGVETRSTYGCAINETIVKDIATTMLKYDLVKSGYTYILLDCWQANSRDANGNLSEDTTRFPSGIQDLISNLHDNGLKIGLTSSAGQKTCQNKPGSKGYETNDATLWASWGVDMIDIDWCGTQPTDVSVPLPSNIQNPLRLFGIMSQALTQTGADILFSVCSRPNYKLDYSHIANMWCSTSTQVTNSFQSWVSILQDQRGLSSTVGAWNYPSALLIGKPGNQSLTEQIGQFAMWSLLNAPLFVDAAYISREAVVQAITDQTLLDIDKSMDYPQGDIILPKNDRRHQVWAKRLPTPPKTFYRYAVSFLVDSDESDFAVINFTDLGIPIDWNLYANVYDVSKKKDLGTYTQLFGVRFIFILTF